MKKIAILFIAMLLVAALTAGALAETFTSRYFTLELPEGWIIDMDDLEEESGEGMEALGFFGSPDDVSLIAGAYLVYDEELKDFSSWNASEEEIEEYKDLMMEYFEEDEPEYIGTVSAGSIPFILIRCRDDESEYLYADTVTNGNIIMFEVCLADEEDFHPLTDEAIEQFKTILATFTPAG